MSLVDESDGRGAAHAHDDSSQRYIHRGDQAQRERVQEPVTVLRVGWVKTGLTGTVHPHTAYNRSRVG